MCLSHEEPLVIEFECCRKQMKGFEEDEAQTSTCTFKISAEVFEGSGTSGFSRRDVRLLNLQLWIIPLIKGPMNHQTPSPPSPPSQATAPTKLRGSWVECRVSEWVQIQSCSDPQGRRGGFCVQWGAVWGSRGLRASGGRGTEPRGWRDRPHSEPGCGSDYCRWKETEEWQRERRSTSQQNQSAHRTELQVNTGPIENSFTLLHVCRQYQHFNTEHSEGN